MFNTRRDFLKQSVTIGAGVTVLGGCDHLVGAEAAAAKRLPGAKMKFGLVTYLWAKDWDLPTLIANCKATGVKGVELRTTHAHGVDLGISAKKCAEVKAMFADSPVTNVGLGSNEEFSDPDPAKVKKCIENTKALLRLSRDTGGSGVKVKPNDFHKEVPREKTIEQIGKSLREVGIYAKEIGQEVRLEVHGSCQELPVIRAIMDVCDHPGSRVCWNSNTTDLKGEGLEHNFNLVKKDFGATCHVWDLIGRDYPYQDLMNLFVGMNYKGWILLEARRKVADKVAALKIEREYWDELLKKAQSTVIKKA